MTSTIIRLLVSTAAGLEAASETYRAVTQQQQAAEALINAEKKAVASAEATRQPIGFHATIQKKDHNQD